MTCLGWFETRNDNFSYTGEFDPTDDKTFLGSLNDGRMSGERLFRTIEIPQPRLYSVSTSPNPITTPGPACNIKLSCDRHLLAAAHKNIDVGPVLAVLKGILVVGEAPSTYSGGKRSGLNTPVHPGSTPKSMSGPPPDVVCGKANCIGNVHK